MINVTADKLQLFFTTIGERCPHPTELFIFGGSALLLLGGQRNTLDVDFTFNNRASAIVRDVIFSVANEFNLDVEESIPAEFIPLPAGSDRRHQLLGQFGLVRVFIFDPYSMALMKLDRAFESDIDDVRFLLDNGFLDADKLTLCLEEIAPRADEPQRLRQNFLLLNL